ncbi:sodium- and chloride-dependent taurine transporter-like isoform X2 [Saccostrea echinata]|uniref:sodium- and chloride-dependent taurine transporter-like isoform X2 n=1 Tax=Saccostrea echinata TaxID=191078 RepID=UPI002A82C2DD|nr:sodium- and chloride-dependent taurine transporter-like isoform X2 [Saccostrea echinata]
MGKESEANNVGLEIQEEHGEGIKKRETWSRKIDFLLACIGFSVGLGNVWRFPYLCYKNGGGAFLIPYFLLVIIGGVPLFYLEVAVGQFMGLSGFRAWAICPLFQGIGISSTIVVFFLNCYYNIILCWSFYYMFSSFALELPWTKCGKWWNTENCYDFSESKSEFVTNVTGREFFKDLVCSNQTRTYIAIYNNSGNIYNETFVNQSCVPKHLRLDAVQEFWENKVLNISDGIEPENMGEIKWDLALTLLFAWVVVYCCICKGIKSSGKVMYVTATSPYLFMAALLIRNSLLPGAREGVIFYLKPDLAKLADLEVWVDAGTQIFFSYSIAIGALTALGSYNTFNHNSYRDCIIFACANSGTSFFAGFIIFTILGHMADVQGVDIADVAAGGPGLAFIAYPKAVSLMPGAPVWSILFFLMLILLGLDSQFVGVEGVISAVVDQWPNLLRRGYRKEIFIGIVCICNFFIGLSMVSRGGMYVFQLFDYYSGSKIILFIAFFECIAIAWVYGIRRFYDNLEMMLGFRINPYMMVAWTVLSPIFCMCVFIMSVVNYSELDYKRPTKPKYFFPTWAVGIGWGMAAFAAMWIPIMIIYRFVRLGFSRETVMYLIKPQGLKEHQLRPQDGGATSMTTGPASKYKADDNPPPYNEKSGNANPAFQSDSGFNTKL